MIWLWVLLAAALTIGGIFWLGRLPAAARPLAGAAVMLGRAQLLAIWRARRARKLEERFAP